MRTIFYVFLMSFLVLSCNRNFEQKKLIGSWKRTNLDSQYSKNYSQKTTFTNDSLIFEEFDKENLVTRISAKYKFDEVSKIINYNARNTKVEVKVLKLTDSEMELLNVNQKKPMKLTRIK